jgi:hypothetical protein
MWSCVKSKRSAFLDLVHFARADELLDHSDTNAFGDLLSSTFLPDASQAFRSVVKRWTSHYLSEAPEAPYECLTAWLQRHACTVLQSSKRVDPPVPTTCT